MGCGGGRGGARELGFERPGHADTVLVHGEALVVVRRREREVGQQVVLVGGVDQAATEHGEEHVLPVVHGGDDLGGLGRGGGPHARFGVELRDAERHDAEAGELGHEIEDAGERVVEHGPVVEPGTAHDLPVDLDPVIEERPEPAEARAASAVAQQVVAHLGIGGVDAHVDGREALGDPRSRSASVKRVRVVKFPYRKLSR